MDKLKEKHTEQNAKHNPKQNTEQSTKQNTKWNTERNSSSPSPNTTDRLGHRICNYSDTDYAAFWADGTRDYEDAVERIALRRLARRISGSCLEIGAGYGRLVNEYAGRCDSVLLTDYAENLLIQARERVRALGLEQVECRAQNLYELERLGRKFDNAVCVRVLHHVEDVPDFFRQVNLVLHDGGCFIFEFANKRNLLEISRWLLRRPNIAPFDRRPSARKGEIYYNFHPGYICEQLQRNGFLIEETLSVSLFRNEALKRLVSPGRLAALEKRLQGRAWNLSPSIFVRARKIAPAMSAAGGRLTGARPHIAAQSPVEAR